jgi:hypothetical protein
VKYIVKNKFSKILLVAAGEKTLPKTIPDNKAKEDIICLLALKDILVGKPVELHEAIKRSICYIQSHYHVGTQQKKDIWIVHEINSYPFIGVCEKKGFSIFCYFDT